MPEVRTAAPAGWLRFVESWIDRWLATLSPPPEQTNVAEVMRLGL